MSSCRYERFCYDVKEFYSVFLPEEEDQQKTDVVSEIWHNPKTIIENKP